MAIAAFVATSTAGLGWASPAVAVPPDGTFLVTVTNGDGLIRVGPSQTWMFTPCGLDCTTIVNANPPWQVVTRLQGSTWSGSDGLMTLSFDSGSLAGTQVVSLPERDVTVEFFLTKNG